MKKKELRQKKIETRGSKKNSNSNRALGFRLYSHREIVFLLCASLVAIASAHITELFGYLPCKLCYYQRYIYYFIPCIAVLALFFRRKLIFFLTLFFLLIAEIAVAFFHVGVEKKWWQYNSECAVNIFSDSAINDLSQIMSQKIVPCDTPQIITWGLSMAGWNTIYAILLIIIFTYLSYANKKSINR